MAGNPLLISPELLVTEGLLNREALDGCYLPQEGKTDYEKAVEVKEKLFQQAWKAFQESDFETLRHDFNDFCENEKTWLQDFALYMVLKSMHQHKPWYEWPDQYKKRDKDAINNLIEDQKEKIEREKWLQFIFFRQWKSLRKYCKKRGIKFFGDIPIYISYDSVDVWPIRRFLCSTKQEK